MEEGEFNFEEGVGDGWEFVKYGEDQAGSSFLGEFRWLILVNSI